MKKVLNYFALSVIMTVFVVPLLIQAQTTGSQRTTGTTGSNPSPVKMDIKIGNPFREDTIPGFIKAIVNDILMPVGGVIAVLMIMYAGFKYVTAGGDTTKIKEARGALLWAVIGAAILLGAWVISEAIQGTIDELRK